MEGAFGYLLLVTISYLTYENYIIYGLTWDDMLYFDEE